MPALPITDSANITSLDSKIVSDFCAGYFYVDVTPSVFIHPNSVQGASVKITNPVGVVISNYPTSGFDIYPPMTSIFSLAIPLIAGNFQYGTYIFDVRLTDGDGDTYTVTKSVNICPPDPNNKTRKYGCMNMSIQGNCRTGQVVFLLNNPPNYKGTTFTSQVNDLTVKYPTESGKADLETTIGSFSLLLYEGQYQVSGTVCALYSYGDEVYFKVSYKVKCEKIIKCIIDECCVFAKLDELNLKVNSDCTQPEKDATASTIVNALWLKGLAELAGNCGADPSDYITQLEELLGCTCTCNCNEGTPIIGTNGASAGGFVYRGLLSQSSTAAPTAVDSDFNTAQITWTRTGVGDYTGTLSGTFTPLTTSNTFIITVANADFKIRANYLSANSIRIQTADSSGTAADSQLSHTSFELSIL